MSTVKQQAILHALAVKRREDRAAILAAFPGASLAERTIRALVTIEATERPAQPVALAIRRLWDAADLSDEERAALAEALAAPAPKCQRCGGEGRVYHHCSQWCPDDCRARASRCDDCGGSGRKAVAK